MKKYLSLSLLLLFSGCISTKFNSLYPCQALFTSSGKTLMMQTHGASKMGSLDVFNHVNHFFLEKGLDLDYAPRQEWMLKAKGINDPLDTAFYSKLLEENYQYLLITQVLGRQPGQIYAHTTSFEKNIPNYNTTHMADAHKGYKMRFELISTATKRPEYSFIVTTKLNPLTIREKDGSESAVNATPSSVAKNKAINKAAKHILKECTCI